MTRSSNAETGSALLSSERNGLRTSNLVYGRITQIHIASNRHDLQGQNNVKVAKSRSLSDRCWPITRERKVPETPKLVPRVHTTICAIKRTSFKVKRSKVKVIRPINAEIKSVSYLPKGKFYELQTRYDRWSTDNRITDKCGDPKVKGQGRKVTWSVWQVLAYQ